MHQDQGSNGGARMSAKLKDEGRLRAMDKYKSKRTDKSKPDSERDSGFSDGSSEHLSVIDQADTDDAACSVGSRSRSSPLAAVVGGTLQRLSPMIIMNNVVLNQSRETPPLKPWSFSPAVDVVQQPQVVFLQPVVPQRTAAALNRPPLKRRRHKKYLPILKSYPKIAPHPGDNPHSSSSASSSSSDSSVKSDSLSSCRSQKDRRHGSQSSVTSDTPNEPGSLQSSTRPPHTSADSNMPGCLTDEGQTHGRPESTDKRSDPPMHNSRVLHGGRGDTDNKVKRFCNTYNILSKSGLLNITLRTKELIRQNRRTQTELERLREHTNLFMEALQTGDSGIWGKLQTSLLEENKTKGKTHRNEDMM
ncbi:CLOCK-interacting pacemaker-like [Xyrauchen texanus]|uniref:CLOCK-interacting pacemaker-like n=1 Tax=Xyrauchen texanus TaxID=154827 RepID=UPI002241A947|nr:CLOCK-interacting pacemaker-like [Xyrauchen texanus]